MNKTPVLALTSIIAAFSLACGPEETTFSESAALALEPKCNEVFGFVDDAPYEHIAMTAISYQDHLQVAHARSAASLSLNGVFANSQGSFNALGISGSPTRMESMLRKVYRPGNRLSPGEQAASTLTVTMRNRRGNIVVNETLILESCDVVPGDFARVIAKDDQGLTVVANYTYAMIGG